MLVKNVSDEYQKIDTFENNTFNH